jgi:hypothetical protein
MQVPERKKLKKRKPKRRQTTYFFSSIIAVDNNTAMIGCHSQQEEYDPSYTKFFLIIDGKWKYLSDINDVVCSTDKIVHKERGLMCCILGRNGVFQEMSVDRAFPYKKTGHLQTSNVLLDLKNIDGNLYACGAHRQIIRRYRWGWADFGEAITENNLVASSVTFTSIAGTSENNLFVASYAGDILHWDGTEWKLVKSPLRLPIWSLVYTKENLLYAGYSGGDIYMRNSNGEWMMFQNHTDFKEIQQMIEFKGCIYISAVRGLLRLRHDQIEPISLPVKNVGKNPFYRMDTTENMLWVVGDQNIFRFDGRKWTNFIVPIGSKLKG